MGAPILVPLHERTLQRHEVYLLAAMYFSGREIDDMVAIAHIESKFNTAARNTNGEDSRGLWQINCKAWPQWEGFNLYDPQVNAWCARQVFLAQGYAAWWNAARSLALV
jgi:hypothetical protein